MRQAVLVVVVVFTAVVVLAPLEQVWSRPPVSYPSDVSAVTAWIAKALAIAGLLWTVRLYRRAA